MKITLNLEYNTDQGLESAEYRFYLVFEENISEEQIVSLFNRERFQSPEIVKRGNAFWVFLNKRTPEPGLVRDAMEAGSVLLEDYSIVQALEILRENLADNFELDQNAIETLTRSKNLADEALIALQEIFEDELTEDYFSAFQRATIGLTREFIEAQASFIKKPVVIIPPNASDIPSEENQNEQRKNHVLKAIDDILCSLEEKISKEEQHSSPEAIGEAQGLLNKLRTARGELENQADTGIALHIASQQFKDTSHIAIESAKTVLQHDLDWSEYLTNLLKTIANIVISLFTSNQNSFFQYAKPPLVAVVEETQTNIAKLE